MAGTALLRYEFTLFARSFTDAFSRTRDRLLLAAVLVLALLWLRQAIAAPSGPGLPGGAVLLALAAAPVAYQWSRLATGRLVWLAEESALAPRAADREARRNYLVSAHLIALVPTLLASTLLGLAAGRTVTAAGLAAAAYGSGVMVAALRSNTLRSNIGVGARGGLVHSPLSGPRTALLALVRVQVLNAARPGLAGLLLVAANGLLTFAGVFLTRDSGQAVQVAASALPSLLLVAVTARNDAGLGGFLAFAGYSSGFVALGVAALPTASFVAASLSALAGGAAGAAIATLAFLHAAAALVAIARIWLSPGRDGWRVDLQVQVEAAGLVVVGLIMPPLGLAALVFRLWRIRGAYRDSIWVQP